jgi:Cft2 family RNA processing exonuclease
VTTPLDAMLAAAADVVLSRKAFAGPEKSAAELISKRGDWLIELVCRSSSLRASVRQRLSEPTALLLVHEDSETAAATIRLAESARAESGRRERRWSDKVKELRTRLDTARGRLTYARADANVLRSSLAEARTAATSAHDDLDGLRARVAAEHHRLLDPRSLACTLLTLLETRSPTPAEADSASRDPRNVTGPAGHEADPVPPPALIMALRSFVEPPRAALSVRTLDLRVTPLGGGTRIGGSCLLVAAGGTRLLIDAGLEPGDPARPPRDLDLAFDGPVPDAVVVTHAHTDHCGYVPALAARLPELRVIATPESCRLMPIMWQDSVKLMHARAVRAQGMAGVPLYDSADFDDTVRRLEELPYGVTRSIGDLTIELFPAGHVLGAAGVVVRAGDRRVVISGDISGFRQESVGGYQIPDSARDADLLVLESTCCMDSHGKRDDKIGHLVRLVEEVYTGGGRVLIPAFALGRAQEVALLLRRHLPHIPVLVDGMAREVSATFESITGTRAHPLEIFGGSVTGARRPQDLEGFTKGVVVTTSGMLTGGPAIEWAARILPEPQSAVFISGYQDEESGGRRLLDTAVGADFTLDSYRGQVSVPVRARVEQIRLSAHADRRGLIEIADEVSAAQTMLVHGVPRRQRDFREVLKVRGHHTVDTGRWQVS